MMCNTMLIAFRKSRYVRPLIKGNAALLTIWSERSTVVVGTVIVVEIKVLEAHHLVKFDPFWEKPGSIFEF